MIELIKSYPYDNNYDYVKLFTSKAEQNTFFNSFRSEVIEDNNYIKVENTFNVNFDYDYLVEQGVNYVLFNNGYKDIYAFIIRKEYIRKNVTRLIYEVDVMQTYMFDFTLKNSFIERKVCEINEITDFDEGINIGEHSIEIAYDVFNKDSTYFAMFNGIKEQSIVFDEKGKMKDVISLPFPTSKPLTVIDGIQYPLYFLPLKESYKSPILTPILPPVGESDVVTSARKLIGKPYIWGGNYPPLGTSEGTDCSGLMMWAFNDCGLLDRVGLSGRWTTYSMIDHTTNDIPLSGAKLGDVIFMNFQNGRPEHVAMIAKIDGSLLRIVEAQTEGVPILERDLLYNESNMKIRRMI